MPFFKPKSKTPPATQTPQPTYFQHPNAYVAPQNQLSTPFQPVTFQQASWDQPVLSQNSNSLSPYGSTTIARPNSAIQNSPQWMPPSPRLDSTALVSYGNTTVRRQPLAVHSPQQWLPPPPLPPRYNPQDATHGSTSPSPYQACPKVGRSSSSTSSLPSPSNSIPTPSSSSYLEAPRSSPWAQPGSARSPSPFAVPQRKQGQPEPPKIRKILSLGMARRVYSVFSDCLY